MLGRYAIDGQVKARLRALEDASDHYADRRRVQPFEEYIRDRREAHDRAVAVVAQKDFRDARLSGRKVIALAEEALKALGHDFSDSGAPQVSLREVDGRLVWGVTYYSVPRTPGGFGTVVIDDTTESTKIIPGL
jgi:hypothetical protein